MIPIGKECTKCGQWQLLIDFGIRNNEKSGYSSWCKDCVNEYARSDHSRKLKKKRLEDPDKFKVHRQQQKNYQKSPKGKASQKKYRDSEKGKANAKRYSDSERGKKIKKQLDDDYRKLPKIRLKACLSSQLRILIRGEKKNMSVLKFVKLNTQQLHDYLTDDGRIPIEGMHIDHIVPIDWAHGDEQKIKDLFHYTNLRLIPAHINMAKSNYAPPRDELPLNIDPKVLAIYEQEAHKWPIYRVN